MESATLPAAPAQPTATPPLTISAERAASDAGDFTAFDKAHVATRTGQPPARVEAPAEKPAAAALPAAGAAEPVAGALGADGQPAAAPAAVPPTRKEREQAEANDRVRRAVEAATTDLQREIADLRAKVTEPARRDDQAPPPAAATWQDTIERPDARTALLSEGEYFTQYPDAPYSAYARYAVAHDRERVQLTTHQREAETAAARDLETKATAYGERLAAAKAADPELASKIPPAILKARPISGMERDAQGRTTQPVTFANIVAEAGLHSENPAALYMHLHAHPDEAARIANLPPGQAWNALLRLDGHLSGAGVSPPDPAAADAAALPETVSAAPPPAPRLDRPGSGGDPAVAALARGDFSTFDRLEMDKARAKRGHRV